MNIAINAISIREGGSAVVLEKLLAEFVALRPDHTYHVVAHTRLPLAPVMQHASVRVHHFPWAERHELLTIWWYVFFFSRWLGRQQISVLYSTTNYLPAGAPIPTVLLVQNASYFCPTFFLERHPDFAPDLQWKLKRAWVRRSIRAATRLTLQTKTLADGIAREVPAAAAKTRVIPHGPGFLASDFVGSKQAGGPRQFVPGAMLHLLYVSKYGPQKNLSVALAGLEKVLAAGVAAHLHLTLEPGAAGTRRVLQAAQARGISQAVTNHGDLSCEAVLRLYHEASVLLYPSVCESFGFPMVEGMACALPVVAADTEGNREVCGAAALYFAPSNADALAESLQRLASDAAFYEECSRRSLERAQNFDWTVAAQRTLECLTEGTETR